MSKYTYLIIGSVLCVQYPLAVVFRLAVFNLGVQIIGISLNILYWTKNNKKSVNISVKAKIIRLNIICIFFLHSMLFTLNTYACIVIFVGRLIEIHVYWGRVQIKPLTRPTLIVHRKVTIRLLPDLLKRKCTVVVEHNDIQSYSFLARSSRINSSFNIRRVLWVQCVKMEQLELTVIEYDCLIFVVLSLESKTF